MRHSPRGADADREVFSANATPIKDHHPAELLPISAILRKLVSMRFKLCMRRCATSLRTPQGRRRACLVAGALLFLVCGGFNALQLPDSDDESHRRRFAPASGGTHRHEAAGYSRKAALANDLAEEAVAQPRGGAALDGSAGAHEAHPLPPPPLPGGAEYASDLRRRADELNREISRFKAREAVGSKQQRLRSAAQQLNAELAQLKQVRQSSFSLKAAAARRAAAVQTQARTQRQQQGSPLPQPLSALRGRLRPSGTGACEPHREFRIAMLMPWIADAHSASRMPPWLPFFVATAAHSAMLIDWIMIHEGPISHEELPPSLRRAAPNVRWVDVGTDGMATLIGRGMSHKLRLPPANATAVVHRLKFMLQKWPRLVAEYKPAFGTIFEQLLANYTHWGYSDLDIVLGQVARFVERSELVDNHIVSYSFGDTEAIYLRGQWTVHQNLPNVNSIWVGCEHLGHGLQQELTQKVTWVRRNEAAGKTNYHKRFLSAEGCYSHRALHTKGIKVKLAPKQFAGLELTTHATDEVYVVNGALWLCKGAADRPPSVDALRTASTPACDHALPGVQRLVAEPERFSVDGEGCGGWVAPEYRVCATKLKGRANQALVLRGGEFYAQKFEELPVVSAEGGRCKQGAFFHMQEWKKRWGDGRGHIDPSAAHDAFKLAQDGIHRLPASSGWGGW